MSTLSDVAQAYFNAWNHPEDVSQILQSQAHNSAKKRFWDDLGDSAYFSVWVPHHINPMWVRCRECKT